MTDLALKLIDELAAILDHMEPRERQECLALLHGQLKFCIHCGWDYPDMGNKRIVRICHCQNDE